MNPRHERDKAKATFEELVRLALRHLDDHERISMLAAGSSWAKWSAAAAVCEFVGARKLAQSGKV